MTDLELLLKLVVLLLRGSVQTQRALRRGRRG